MRNVVKKSDLAAFCPLSFKAAFSQTAHAVVLLALASGCQRPAPNETAATTSATFDSAMVSFAPHRHNPVFSGTGADTWDRYIRERGYILREGDAYHLWYTGYGDAGEETTKALGYATSKDGIEWVRHEKNPVFKDSWVEDVMVVKNDSLYYMFAEGRADVAHMLSSTDKINWQDHGPLRIQYTNGEPLAPGPYGTPTVFLKDGVWYLYYERNDEGIWLATTRDLQTWIHVQDEAVIAKGPEAYDKFGVALNQVVSHNGLYYAYYHGTAFEDWSVWSTNVAVSHDLVHWEKYSGNPVVSDNKSSGILVNDGTAFRLYTMHPEVNLHFQKAGSGR